MSKYSGMGEFLVTQDRDFVPITFEEIEGIIGRQLPASKKYPAWWSNNPSNNPMTREWLKAGYETEQVDTVHGKLVFRKLRDGMDKDGSTSGGNRGHAPMRSGRPPIFGAMQGTIVILPETDIAAPTEPDWGRDPRDHG